MGILSWFKRKIWPDRVNLDYIKNITTDKNLSRVYFDLKFKEFKDKKIMNYASEDYLEELRCCLMEYIPAGLPDNVKPKREAMVKETYGDCFRLQIEAYGIIHKIEMSHLLGMNEVVLPVLVEEYGQLRYVLKLLETRLKKMTQYEELQNIVAEMTDAFGTKGIGSHLYNDLDLLITKFGIDAIAKDFMASYKNYEPDEEFVKRLNT